MARNYYAEYAALAARARRAADWAREGERPRLAALLDDVARAVEDIPRIAVDRDTAARRAEIFRQREWRLSSSLMTPRDELLDRLHRLHGWPRAAIHQLLAEVVAYHTEQDAIAPTPPTTSDKD